MPKSSPPNAEQTLLELKALRAQLRAQRRALKVNATVAFGKKAELQHAKAHMSELAQLSLVAFMQNSPLTDLADEAFARNSSLTRSIDL
jgi:hypothetical protein